MGQKVHPLGFRLGITQDHKNQWFEEMKDYPKVVYQDFVLRNCLLNNLKNADITSIKIERNCNQIVIKVVAARSRIITSQLDQITQHLNHLLQLMNNTHDTGEDLRCVAFDFKKEANALANTNIFESKLKNHPQKKTDENIFLLVGSSSPEIVSNSAFLTAKSIQEQLEKRVPFRRAVRVALKRGSTPKGIKIQISGRLNGAEIARSEWIRQGRVPLHTLRAQVDYCSHQAATQYGILGIKVWIFQGYGKTDLFS